MTLMRPRQEHPQCHNRPAAAWLLAPLACVLLAGCATRTQSTDSFLGFITPYRIEIVQGNAVTKEQVNAVRPGMTREQVQAILGTPMLIDPFHADRWDYVFTMRRPGTSVQRREVVAHFSKAGTLDRLQAPDDLPDEAGFVAGIVPALKGKPVELELSEAQRKALPVPQARADSSSAAAPQGAARTYPPLEPK
jgi:outer membrane protein assembly factor BamE